MTIRQWFDDNFGTDVVIDGLDAWGNQEIVRKYFPTDTDGSLFVLCGGQCIMAFDTPRIDRRPVYLVVEPEHYRHDGGKRDRLALHQSA